MIRSYARPHALSSSSCSAVDVIPYRIVTAIKPLHTDEKFVRRDHAGLHSFLSTTPDRSEAQKCERLSIDIFRIFGETPASP